MSGAFKGKRALVTGAGRGIGRAIAIGLAGEGASVVLLARSEHQLAEVAATIRASDGDAALVAAANRVGILCGSTLRK